MAPEVREALGTGDLQGSDQEIVGMEDFNPEDRDPRPLPIPPLRQVVQVLAVLGVLAALVFVPPLVSLNRYRRQIASSISASLGRPVRIDSVALTLLPMPGFRLQNFSVGEDAGFGSEPIIRANSVTVMLRVSSLWRRQVEFSRILLDAPSVNLVRLADGRWNLESILLQASRVRTAPTVQKRAGPAPRFPYIEATGGRLNLKMGLEKTPISLTDASFALWLPQPDRWQLRLEAHPARTDTAASDTGTLRVEGSLGRAHAAGDVPVNLSASWNNAPLGAASWILLGYDAGVRGDLFVRANVRGTAGDNVVTSELTLNSVRRADFVPEAPLTVNLDCSAHALELFHRLDQVRCQWPLADGGRALTVAADLPRVTDPAAARVEAKFERVPAAALLKAGRALSPRIARGLHAGGEVAGDLRFGSVPPPPAAGLPPGPGPGARARRGAVPARSGLVAPVSPVLPRLSGSFGIAQATLVLDGAPPFVTSAISGVLEAPGGEAAGSGSGTGGAGSSGVGAGRGKAARPVAQAARPVAPAGVGGEQLVIAPFALDLGGQTPAMLSVRMDRASYRLHLTGPVLRARLSLLARSLPQFGDGLAEALADLPNGSPAPSPSLILRVNLESDRPWRGKQVWTEATAAPVASRRQPGSAGRSSRAGQPSRAAGRGGHHPGG